MSIDKYKITRLTNRKPINISKIQTNEKDCGIVMNYHQTITTQIVEAQEKREFECICAEIQKFIEENNIDVCFAINKNELIDCLQEHQIAKLKISDLEAKLAESEKEIEKLNACVDFYKSYYISFKEKVIDELEKVKEKINNCPITDYDTNKHFVKMYQSDAIRQLDNQINQLKEGEVV